MTSTIKRITARLALTAAYEGTKVKDLTRYIKGFVPGARIYTSGPDNPGRDPGANSGVLTLQQAHELGRKLIEDGWYGRKVIQKIRPKPDFNRQTVTKPGEDEPRERHYVYYVPSSENGVQYKSLGMPYIKLLKPTPGDDRVRIEFGQATHASARERDFLRKLNRPYRPVKPSPHSTARGRGGFGW